MSVVVSNSGVPSSSAFLQSGLGRVTATAADAFHDALEGRGRPTRGLLASAGAPRCSRRLYPVALQDAPGCFEGRRVWGREAASRWKKGRRDHVGEQEAMVGPGGRDGRGRHLEYRDVLLTVLISPISAPPSRGRP